MRLQLMKSMNVLTGLTYLDLRIKQINHAKEIFLLDVAQGSMVYIPPELSQRHLPFSFKFYDPIMNIISQEMKEELKGFYLQNRNFAVEQLI